MTDSDRETQLDKMLVETRELVDQANQAVAKLRESLKSVGSHDPGAVRRILESDQCPPELRKQASEDLQKLHEELAEEENRLRLSSGQGGESRPPRSGMTRI